jgi:hypothetical protein
MNRNERLPWFVSNDLEPLTLDSRGVWEEGEPENLNLTLSLTTFSKNLREFYKKKLLAQSLWGWNVKHDETAHSVNVGIQATTTPGC